jgi:hypothetical protein
MQVWCRHLNFLENGENKGEFCDFNQTRRLKNCAICDAVAQSKLRWRKFGGAS